VVVDNTAVHTLNEEQIAMWRGRAIGGIFQFFQLLQRGDVTYTVLIRLVESDPRLRWGITVEVRFAQ